MKIKIQNLSENEKLEIRTFFEYEKTKESRKISAECAKERFFEIVEEIQGEEIDSNLSRHRMYKHFFSGYYIAQVGTYSLFHRGIILYYILYVSEKGVIDITTSYEKNTIGVSNL